MLPVGGILILLTRSIMPKLIKTSLQLPPTTLEHLDRWPGLSRSEVLRLYIERGQYLSCINSEYVADLAHEFSPILFEALQDLNYDDYRLAARSLPTIIAGFFSEVLGERASGRSWRCPDNPERHLDPEELVEKLTALNIVERIGILDCIVAERHRKLEKTAAK
jgi:hypothetical protein